MTSTNKPVTDKTSQATAEAPKKRRGGKRPTDPAALSVKTPNAFHKALAEYVTEETGVEVTAKHAQIVMVMLPLFRRSAVGKELAEARKGGAAARREEKRLAQIAAAEKRIAELKAEGGKSAA